MLPTGGPYRYNSQQPSNAIHTKPEPQSYQQSDQSYIEQTEQQTTSWPTISTRWDYTRVGAQENNRELQQPNEHQRLVNSSNAKQDDNCTIS